MEGEMVKCPCCGAQIYTNKDFVLHVSNHIGSESVRKQTYYKGIIIQRRAMEIETIAEKYEQFEAYACKSCAEKHNRVKKYARFFSVFCICCVIIGLPLIALAVDESALALAIVAVLFTLFYLKRFYRFLNEDIFWPLFSKCFASKINVSPSFEHTFKCRALVNQKQAEGAFDALYKAPFDVDRNNPF